MRVFSISSSHISEIEELTTSVALQRPEAGFLWISCTREELELEQARIQAALQALSGSQLVDLHISDLLNQHLPSHFDYTSQYDVIVFRRLAASDAISDRTQTNLPRSRLPARGGPPVLRRIDTSPVGFAVFDQVLLSVHPVDCAVRESYCAKLLQAATPEARATGLRLPNSPADLMLRIVNQMVDAYLGLRRQLTHQLDHWQAELINPKTRFSNWSALLEARLALHHLDEICEDQRSALLDWIEVLKTWPDAQTPNSQRERDLLQVRSRDVLEHIERVVHHVRRLEQSAETAVQMHFSAQSHRTNEIMRTLTALTAIFLPLNLIAGIFGMNFEFIPLLHRANGFWMALGSMLLIAATLVLVFARKRYLGRSGR